jgi:hypothetical protein
MKWIGRGPVREVAKRTVVGKVDEELVEQFAIRRGLGTLRWRGHGVFADPDLVY